MILYNPSLADVETDNHWLPAIHLADGTAFVAFMGSHAGVTGSFPAAEKRNGQGDVMAAFSSRGPAGLFIKPDVTAPGVEILAGNTPTPEEPTSANGAGPADEYYQAIAGTSMSAPHVAGAALLVMAVHPGWTPGEIKSALMTTATTNVVKEDLTTPADPFDMGSGRIDIGAAASAPLVFNETADDFFAMGNDPTQAGQLNLASIDATVMPGHMVVTRTVTNTTSKPQHVSVSTSSPSGTTISVSPDKFTIAPGLVARARDHDRLDSSGGRPAVRIDHPQERAGRPARPGRVHPQAGRRQPQPELRPDHHPGEGRRQLRRQCDQQLVR